MKRVRFDAKFRTAAIVACLALAASAGIALLDERTSSQSARSRVVTAALDVDDQSVPPHQEPAPPPPPPPPPPPATKPHSKTAGPAPAPPISALRICGAQGASAPRGVAQGLWTSEVYKGVGAWVDAYDFCIAGDMDPFVAVDAMAARGVGTLYLQTSRWKEPHDIVHVAKIVAFLDRANLRGIQVIGWYLPGFVDLDRDLRRSLAVLNFSTPSGSRFSGFAADIETREEVGPDRDRFNNGIAEYSRRLRATASPGAALGAIVVDARNNERAPGCGNPYDSGRCRWHGFPWQEIAQNFDVVMPMAYWTVTKPKNGTCLGTQYDAAQYVRDVIAKTESLMSQKKPLHLIGGIADCVTSEEVNGYVNASKELGTLGGSLYDFATTEANPSRDGIWTHLSRFNQ